MGGPVARIDWSHFAQTVARAWAPHLPTLHALDLAANAFLPFAMGVRPTEDSIGELVIAGIAHRRVVLAEPAFAGISDQRANELAKLAVVAYQRALVDAQAAAAPSHLLWASVRVSRVAETAWCGRVGPLVVYLVRRGPLDWRVSIGDARAADYGDRHVLAVGSGATPETAADSAVFGLSPEHVKILVDCTDKRMYSGSQDDAAR